MHGRIKKNNSELESFRRLFPIIILSGLLFLFPSADALSEICQIDASGGRLSLDVAGMPLSAVIDEIGAKTGIQFLFLNGDAEAEYNDPVSFQFELLPTRSVLEKVLKDLNCSMICDGQGNIRQVFILGSKSPGDHRSKASPPMVSAKQYRSANSSGPAKMMIGPNDGGGSHTSAHAIPEGMIVNPTDQTLPEGVVVNPPGGRSLPEGLVIHQPGKSGLATGMVITPGDDGGIGIGEQASKKVIQYQGEKVSPEKVMRSRLQRWGLRK